MLDPLSLFVALIVTHFIATLILIFAWRFNPSIPGVGFWALGRMCILLALIVLSLREVSPFAPSVLVGNAALFLGMFFVWRGNLAFMERPMPHVVMLGVFYVGVLAAMMYWAVVEPNFTARAVLSSLAIVLFDVMCIRALWPRLGDEVYFFGKLMVGVFALNGLLHLARLAMSFMGEGGQVLMEPSAGVLAALVGGLATTMASAMAYLAMIMEHLKKDLQRQAERDPLTGVYNRRAFDTVAGHVLARGRRNSDAVSLVILDLDHFKAVNDSHGHVVGDTVLKRIADLVQGILRGQDILMRLGGEEFVMLLPATALAEARHVAERIRKAVEAEVFETGADVLRVTTSLGVTSVSVMSDEHGIDDLIKLADVALYQAKDEGRNRVCVA